MKQSDTDTQGMRYLDSLPRRAVTVYIPLGIVSFVLKGWGIDWNWILKGDQAMLLVVIASVWKQIPHNFLFFLAGLQSIPKIGRASCRERV